MSSDRRVLFFGDSFIAGYGDPHGQGWVGRVVAASFQAGLPLTAYNLGVRRETSLDVATRWRTEADPRKRAAAAGYGVVFGFGVNDTTEEDGRVRVQPGVAVDALGRVLAEAAWLGLSPFVVGPAPSGDPSQDDRVRELSRGFADVAAEHGVRFADVFDALCASGTWADEAAAGDGTHPAAGGYVELAGLVLAAGWLDWLEQI